MQPFGISQAPHILDQRKALRRFWERYGSIFRRTWLAWGQHARAKFSFLVAAAWSKTRENQRLELAGTDYNNVEEIRLLVQKPFGDVSTGTPCLLPEIAETCGGAGKRDLDLLELIRQRATGMCLLEDVQHVAQLKAQGRLPKLQPRKNDEYLCSDMLGPGTGMCAGQGSGQGPFVVFVGTREGTYGVSDHAHDQDREEQNPSLLTPKIVTATAEYACLRDCEVKANVSVYSAPLSGPMRTSLMRLLEAGAATEAPVYIYAALKQTMLLEFLLAAARIFGEKHIEGFDSGITAAPECYVCSRRTGVDGEKLRQCEKCRSTGYPTYYCSRECQKKDWPRHRQV